MTGAPTRRPAIAKRGHHSAAEESRRAVASTGAPAKRPAVAERGPRSVAKESRRGLATRGAPAKRPAIALDWTTAKGERLAKPVRSLAGRYLRALELVEVEVSILLTGDRGIRKLNRVWRQKDEPTDVLSFPAGEAPRPPGARRSLGDIVISLDTAQRRARDEQRPLRDELALYLAHGLLHLLGHDHHRPAESKRMAAAERKLLGSAGLIAPAHGER